MLPKETLDAVLDLHASTLKLPDTDVPAIALPKGVEVESLERFFTNRARFRGTYSTPSLSGFVEYAEDRESYACFVDPETMSAEAIFNRGTLEKPGHCDDTAKLTMVKTAPFKALHAVNGQRLEQRAAAEWLEDWRAHIMVLDVDGEQLMLQKACAALRSMTVEHISKVERSVGDFSESEGVLASVTAKAKNEAQPAVFRFGCSPYEGLSERSFEVRISAIIERGGVAFTYRIMRYEDEVEKMAQELADRLDEKLTKGKLFLGKFSK